VTAATYPRFALTQWVDTRFDRLAIGLSGLCAVHCVASAIFLAFVASIGAALLNPLWHEIGLSLAVVFGLIALGRGFLTHGYAMPLFVGSFGLGMMAGAVSLPYEGGMETVYTVIGVALLALGHDLNRRATH
jgi:hypothetical protein